MKVGELYDKFLQAGLKDLDGSEESMEKIYAFFKENITVNTIGAETKLALVRAVNQGCMKKIGVFEYIDKSLQKITMDITIATKMANLEVNKSKSEEDNTSGSVVNYDQIRQMYLKEYLQYAYPDEMYEFDSFIELENDTEFVKNSYGAILAKQMLTIANNKGDK